MLGFSEGSGLALIFRDLDFAIVFEFLTDQVKIWPMTECIALSFWLMIKVLNDERQ